MQKEIKARFECIDWERLEQIARFQDMNSDVIRIYANYLLNYSTFITKELVDQIREECEITQEYAFYVLLAAYCGLDLDNNQRDFQIANEYILPSIKKLDANTYKENLYYQNIKIPTVQKQNWELKYEAYQPYEGFIYNDISVEKDYREFPRLGFFEEEFRFPAVLESNVEWMTITPNEIETMQPIIDCVTGDIVTFGLGLGYFTYMASMKEEVKSITVVERDEKVIDLFKTYLLPQFLHKEKVHIIQMDAFEFVKNHMVDRKFAYAFVDLWHDASDGFPMYLQMKKLETLCSSTKFSYWIEPSFLSYLRSDCILVLLRNRKKQPSQSAQSSENLEETQLEQRLQAIEKYILTIESKYSNDIDYYLSNHFLRKLATTISDEMAN